MTENHVEALKQSFMIDSFPRSVLRARTFHSASYSSGDGGISASRPLARNGGALFSEKPHSRRRGRGVEVETQLAASRWRARLTVAADQGLPVGVATLRALKMRAILRADFPASRPTAASVRGA